VTGWLAPALALVAVVLAIIGLAQLAAVRRPGRGRRSLVGLLVAGGSRVRAVRTLAPPPDLRARVQAAGRPGGLGVREVMAVKAAAAACGAALALPLAAAAPGRLGPLVVLVGPAAGFLGPDLWLGRRARARAQRVRRELPAMLDLLRVTVEAGGSLAASLGAVGERGGGALAAEWRAVAREVGLGVGLSESLRAMTRRLPQPEIQALVAALERARRHGAPLAETLEAQARDARFALRRKVQEDAARAGPKIQLVVALMLVPSVLLLVAAALAAALLGGETSLPVGP
jgi:tight adherence protein C